MMIRDNHTNIFDNLAKKVSSKDNLSLQDLTRAHNSVEDAEHCRQLKTFVIKSLLRIVGLGGVALVLLLFFQGIQHVPGVGYQFSLNEWALRIFVVGYLGVAYGLLRYPMQFYFPSSSKGLFEKIFEGLFSRKKPVSEMSDNRN